MIKSCEFGEIEYRLPNVPEVLEILGMIGLKASDLQGKELNELVLAAGLMKNSGHLVTRVSLKVGETEVTTYKEALEHVELMPVIFEFANDVMSKITVDSKKKTQLDKPQIYGQEKSL